MSRSIGRVLPRRARAWLAVAGLALALGGQGCTALKVAGIVQGALIVGAVPPVANLFYNGQPYQSTGFSDVADSVRADSHVPVMLATVEVNEGGYFADPRQAEEVLAELSGLARTHNLSVVVYAHGWRHNSSKGDPDVALFRAALNTLNGIVRKTGPTPSSLNGRHLPRMVVGIYLGWKGKATFEWPDPPRFMSRYALVKPVGGLWSLAKGLGSLHVYSTFWGRKIAADRSGRGDLRRFIIALGALHESWQNPASAYNSNSLNLIGHSFGGHLMLSALRDELDRELIEAEIADSSRTVPAMLHLPNDPADRGLAIANRLHSRLGNIILINPAVEEAQFRYIYEMTRVSKFPDGQAPLIAIFSAENDWARKILFNVGTRVSNAGGVFGKGQWQLATTALGSGTEFVTDTLRLIDATPARALSAKRAADTTLAVAPQGVPRDSASAGRWVPEDVVNEDRLVGLFARDGIRRPRATVIAWVDKRVIDGHSGFWRAGFIQWLVSYVVAVDRAQVHAPSRSAH